MFNLQHGATPHPCLRRLQAARDQRGMSLIEVLLAVVLMSIVVLGIAAGFQTTTKLSARAGERAALQAALNSATDRVANIAYPYCASASQITTSANADAVAPTGFTFSVTGVRYLVPNAPTCTPGNAGTSALALQVKLVSTKDPSLTITGETVLRNPAARPA